MPSEIHKYGTDDGWYGVIEEGGEFPPEKDRYHLYIGSFPGANLYSYSSSWHYPIFHLLFNTIVKPRYVRPQH